MGERGLALRNPRAGLGALLPEKPGDGEMGLEPPPPPWNPCPPWPPEPPWPAEPPCAVPRCAQAGIVNHATISATAARRLMWSSYTRFRVADEPCIGPKFPLWIP